MRFLAFAALCLLGIPSRADAALVASLDWYAGDRAACDLVMKDRWVFPGESPALYLSVRGLDDTSDGYEATLELVPQDGGAFPDAWRFDLAGCAAARWDPPRLVPPSQGNGCGSLALDTGISGTAVTRTFDETAQHLKIDLYVTLDGPETIHFPNDPFMVFLLPLNQAGGVNGPSVEGSCGGLERPLCLALRTLRFHRPDGSWFEAATPLPVATANAAGLGGPSACSAVPARPATWGALKAGYR
jgi:hypothetical protein